MQLSALICIVAGAGGCGSSTKPVTLVPPPNVVTGLPTPAAAGPVNTYNGGQSPGAWTLNLDDTKNAFSYQPVTYPAQPVTGSLQVGGGFSSLGAAGLVYEVLGRAAVLRPGSSATSPIFAVPQTGCYAITGKMRFQYIDLYPGSLATFLSETNLDPLGYGSIVASTDPTGKTWQFENLQGSAGPVPNVQASVVSGPASFTGSCAASNSEASIGLSGPSLLDAYWATTDGTAFNGPSFVSSLSPTAQSIVWVGPSGFFAADQSDPVQVPSSGASVAGMAEPASPLSTSAVAAGQYLGFLYQAPISASSGSAATTAFTAPVGFGQVVPSSGSTITGGIFPNDDVTGTPNSDTQITLGTQDSTVNGLYASVSITVLDPAQNCANFPGSPIGFPLSGVSSSVNALGYVTCTFPGVAIAGNPDGKYAIFVSAYNWAAALGGVPEEFFLFQQ
ncbi:hypothetical protein ACPOL_0155 [Acidisarcina polymorpha]|uniref:Uncharacterized protein n=1 Tax=Acidisarcina polymorpha TaxID=2211140 RepID=A0A2Z5FS30_9BACT|nr:hypothetical protein ACPOL_0155 [Acidisarcina polymorpha]